MPPFLPVLAISRSQRLRVGRGPGDRHVFELNSGDTPTHPHTGALIGPTWIDLGEPFARRDFQRHAALGALVTVGAPSQTTWSDLFRVSGLAVTAGSGFTLAVSAGVIQSRYSGAQLAVNAATLTPQTPLPVTGGRTSTVVVSPSGGVSLIPGADDLVAPVYEVDSVVTSGVPTGGTFKLSFTYNGFYYTTANIAFNASAATVASAILAATGGPALPAGTLAGTGGALPTAVTLTASGALEGPITNQTVSANALTGGTNPQVAFTRTTAGVGNTAASSVGRGLPLAQVYIPSTSASSSDYTITTIALTS